MVNSVIDFPVVAFLSLQLGPSALKMKPSSTSMSRFNVWGFRFRCRGSGFTTSQISLVKVWRSLASKKFTREHHTHWYFWRQKPGEEEPSKSHVKRLHRGTSRT